MGLDEMVQFEFQP